jgi:hypothetical protein
MSRVKSMSDGEIDRVLEGARATWKAGIAADEATRVPSERRLAEVVPPRKMIVPLTAFAFAAAFTMLLLARRTENAPSIVPEPHPSVATAAAVPEPLASTEPSSTAAETSSTAAEPAPEPARVVHAPAKSALPPLPPPPEPRERAHYRRVFADRPPEQVFDSATELARAAATSAEQAAIWEAALERMPSGPLRARAATERARAAARTMRHRKTDL